MTKAEYKRQALESVDRAARLLASASHDYELAECDRESTLTYDLCCDVRDMHSRIAPRRRKKARK